MLVAIASVKTPSITSEKPPIFLPNKIFGIVLADSGKPSQVQTGIGSQMASILIFDLMIPYTTP